jgi:predicted RNA-binding protein
MKVAYDVDPSDRTMIEALCCVRPELVDALWKCDMQWESQRPVYVATGPFMVTSNSSFHRAEVRDFLARIAHYKKHKKLTPEQVARTNVVLLPCAADKPFPAPMHEAVLSMLPDATWYAAIVTGVCGIVPQEMWAEMPWYDSGIPNRWRVYTACRDYFRARPHARVVMYMDFYSEAVFDALNASNHSHAETVNPVQFYYDYLDLGDNKRLLELRALLRREVKDDTTNGNKELTR